ncbi:MAG TPA: XrtA system polysaccharide deacetylase [Phycisphaerae bacterium]|nr:XrtA system polysaccharide deacetylase [Phycisphaerae bacterium]
MPADGKTLPEAPLAGGRQGLLTATSPGTITNILTIDVEDWYHCLDPDPANWPRYERRVVPEVRTVLEVLEETSTTATFFVLGHVARSQPALIREIDDAGHEVASHGSEHRFIYRQSPSEFRTDVRRSVSTLEDTLGRRVRGYRAPYFSITAKSLWALDVLGSLGMEYDSSIFPVFNHRYGIPGAPRLPYRTPGGLVELPPATFPLAKWNVPCGGGVYFRFLPFAVLRRLFRLLNHRREPVVFYLHPWELDPLQPRADVPPFLRLRHYHALRGARAKFKRLLEAFRFSSIREVLSL